MYYFDNAATTAQKPDCVAKAVYQVLSSGLSATRPAGPTDMPQGLWPHLAGQGRREGLFHCGPEYDVAFTHNSTAALNMVLKGLIRRAMAS